MPSRPRLYQGGKLPGLAAVALFAVLALVFVGNPFGTPAGFAGDTSITAGIGYLMFDFTSATPLGDEGFLAAFEMIDVLLVAALVGAVMLARRDDDTEGDTETVSRRESEEVARADGGRIDDEGGER